MINSRHTTWHGDNLHGKSPVLTAVWVNLDALFARAPDASRHVIETGLDLTGSVPSRLHGRFASVNGDWCGCPPGLKLTVDRWFAECDDSP